MLMMMRLVGPVFYLVCFLIMSHLLFYLALASPADMERNLMSRMHAQDKNRFRAVGLSSVLLLVSVLLVLVTVGELCVAS